MIAHASGGLALPAVACITVGLSAPLIGTFLVQKRLSLIGDGVGHVAFAGVGAGLLLGVWPVWTALAFAVAGATGVEVLRSRKRASGDLALALFFYAGLALGAVFASRAGNVELESLPYLFGEPEQITTAGVVAVVLAAVAVVGGTWVLHRALFAVVTDEDWARAQGLPVDLLNIGLAAVTATIIVAGMRIVGLLLTAALMVLPVATAQLIARSFRTTLWLALALGGASAVVGLGLGRWFDVTVGGAIVLVAAAVFAVTAIAKGAAPRALRQEEH